MILANLMVSVFVEPLFQLLVSSWTLAFVIGVEFLSIWLISRTGPVPTFLLVAAANVLSTAIGFVVLWTLPARWNVVTSAEQLREWRVALIVLGYALCFLFSFLIEAGAYRVFAIRSKTRIRLRAAVIANALSYALTPLALWLYDVLVRMRY